MIEVGARETNGAAVGFERNPGAAAEVFFALVTAALAFTRWRSHLHHYSTPCADTELFLS